VEAKVEPDNEASLRVATRSGLRREGVRRVEPGTGDRPETSSYVILARLASDPPLTEPEGFRALLNSFLPRKRAISQVLVRDHDGRVLVCRLTYKRDWDLPGGVVEVGESPRLAAGREIEEELALTIEAGDLLLTDWLPPWSGWDDAVCLVFDGGEHDASLTEAIVKQTREIRHAEFATLEEVRERCADFTARRIETALANARGEARTAYVEGGGATTDQ
jgi:8-oxo-dGTP pyrophosphatase MutT (NUDIX family)